jgi:hypothetical protein
MIIRHAEKPEDPNDPDLTPKGYQRAQGLSKLFQIHPDYAAKGLPIAIYAAQYIPGKNAKRAILTATPLAQALGLELNANYRGSDFQSLASEILNSEALNGKVVFISWVHGDIPSLASALGGNCANKWPGAVFDRIWQLDFVGSEVTCTNLPESVLPGDSN